MRISDWSSDVCSSDLTRSPPAPIIVAVCGGVPSVGGHVDPPAECQGIVDDDDLLMMGGADWMCAVELERDIHVTRPAHRDQGSPATAEQLERAHIPHADMNLQLRPLTGKPKHTGAQLVLTPHAHVLWNHIYPRLDD